VDALEESRPFALDCYELELPLHPIAPRNLFCSDLYFLLFRLGVVNYIIIRGRIVRLVSVRIIDGREIELRRRLWGFVIANPEPVCVERS
jgi:hypothetical protein